MKNLRVLKEKIIIQTIHIVLLFKKMKRKNERKKTGGYRVLQNEREEKICI